MAQVVSFTFNPFQENTYLIFDDTKEAIIIDPGCYDDAERDILSTYIKENNLRPVRLINTHCHIDHVFGNAFVQRSYNLPLEIHEGEIIVLAAAEQVGFKYGIPYPDPSPEAEKFIAAGDLITFGNTTLKTLFTPGHSPASISFYCEADQFVIAGDVLFQESIGRTDLPGGDFTTLAESIRREFYTLPDEVVVFPGHGSSTTVGHEKRNNPFVKV